MDHLIYEKIAKVEESHFYYKSNRELISLLIEKHGKGRAKKPLKILDAGCGTGFTAKYLKRFGRVWGVDINPLAVKHTKARRIKVTLTSIDKLPFHKNTFDLVVCFDVIYHKGVKNDDKALSEIYRVLKPGGICILRVPARISIQSSYDKLVHTRHRYTKEELERKLRKSRYNILKLSYVDAYLLPLILVSNLVRNKDTADKKPHIYRVPRIINFLLTQVSLMEKRLVGYVNLPFGTGLFAVVAKLDREFGNQKLATILKWYLEGRPAFLSIIRAKEALLFSSFMPYHAPILDYGSGDGFFMETSFGQSGQKVDFGLEVDSKRAASARSREIYDKVVVYSGKVVPFPNNTFSTIVSNSVLEHIFDIDRSLKEVHRVLKKSGRFYVTITTSRYEENLFGTLFLGDLYKRWMRKRAYHASMLSEDDIETKFSSAGFRVLKKIGYLNKENTRFLDVMQYLSIPGKIPGFSKFYNYLCRIFFMNTILRRIANEIDDRSFCCYFYILSKK